MAGRMRLTPRGRLAVALLVAGLLLVGGCTTYLLTRTDVGTALGLHVRPPCALQTGDGTVRLGRDRAMSLTTVAAVGDRMGLSTDVVAARVGDLLRSPERIVTAAAARTTYRLAQGGSTVQTPSARDRAVADALLGRRGAALTCTVQAFGGDLAAQPLGATGLTARAQVVHDEVTATFGRLPMGGYAPGGVRSGHVPGSAHYEGRAIDVFFRPIGAENQRRGWVLANWAVAHAETLELATVIFDKQIWTSDRSFSGWRAYTYPLGDTDNKILLHEDHVHLDVQRGSDRS